MSDKLKPVAWLHTVRDTGGVRETDHALSFEPDNFPLNGMFQSLSAEPLYDQAAIDAAVAAERERCAKLCETFPSYQARDCAAAIRQAPAE